ncbi:hypothetical protein INT80_06480 [Gallibacterium anatis]|uniref:Uncharacterized protein n=1 Tax=Gallibacterium anatis TaxID=750 RepID=A0A930USN6_9PAST|nr:hypothetical protein [Gallibacterium anatis]
MTVIHGGSIKTGTVIAEKLAANSVTTEKITAGAVNASRLRQTPSPQTILPQKPFLPISSMFQTYPRLVRI